MQKFQDCMGRVVLQLLQFLTPRTNLRCGHVFPMQVLEKLSWFLPKQPVRGKIPKLFGLGWVANVAVLDSTNKFALWARVSHVEIGRASCRERV